MELAKTTGNLECQESNEIKLCTNKNNEEKLISDILAESNVQPSYINEIVRKIHNNFEYFKKNQDGLLQ